MNSSGPNPGERIKHVRGTIAVPADDASGAVLCAKDYEHTFRRAISLGRKQKISCYSDASPFSFWRSSWR
jgi:hypothetical protein